MLSAPMPCAAMHRDSIYPTQCIGRSIFQGKDLCTTQGVELRPCHTPSMQHAPPFDGIKKRSQHWSGIAAISAVKSSGIQLFLAS